MHRLYQWPCPVNLIHPSAQQSQLLLWKLVIKTSLNCTQHHVQKHSLVETDEFGLAYLYNSCINIILQQLRCNHWKANQPHSSFTRVMASKPNHTCRDLTLTGMNWTPANWENKLLINELKLNLLVTLTGTLGCTGNCRLVFWPAHHPHH